MKNLKFVQAEKGNVCHYNLLLNLMISYNKELDAHQNRKTSSDVIRKVTQSMVDIQGDYDRHLELCYDNDILIGFYHCKVDHYEHKGFIKPGYGYIMEFYVIPEFRRKGYGKDMFRRIEFLFGSHETRKMYLTSDPVTGKPFWLSNGFINTGKTSPENQLEIYEKEVQN